MRIWLAAAAVLMAMQAPLALADRDPNSGAPLPPKKRESSSPITDHFYIKAAYFAPKVRTTVRTDPSNAPAGVTGTGLSGENDLGLPERLHEGRLDFMFRMRERNKIRLDYLEANRSGTRAPANDITFGNTVFPAGAPIQTTLNFRMGDLTYTYSFYRSDRLEIGTGIAVYLIDSQLSSTVPASFLAQNISGAGPIPALPLDFTWRVSDRFAFTARGAYLHANAGGVHGSFEDLHADVQYRWKANFALGIGYSNVKASFTRDPGGNPAEFSLGISGPEAFLRFSF